MSVSTIEAFHLAFLRGLARSLDPDVYCLKGGSNLRFFFHSIRYSEDIDLDAHAVPVAELRDKVMGILRSPGLAGTMRVHGVEAIRPPDLARAKQTETVQRFKVHLITTAGEDLATKIEFSRRGMDTPIRVEAVDREILAAHHMAPLIVSHYSAVAATRQKILALAGRNKSAARDVFDLHLLSTHPDLQSLTRNEGLTPDIVAQARDRLFAIEYEQYRDTVVAFLGPDDQPMYERPDVWDEIQIVVDTLLDRGARDGQ